MKKTKEIIKKQDWQLFIDTSEQCKPCITNQINNLVVPSCKFKKLK